jgi:hypothetical protein
MEGCHHLGTRDWYLMHYSNPVVTGGQKHTHILGANERGKRLVTGAVRAMVC